MRFTIFQDSHIGGRKVNQDRQAYSYSRDVLLMVIADGMGGHARGEIAAEIAVNTLTNRFQQEARSQLRRPGEFLEASFNAAHRAIVAFADQHDMLESPRTTLVACIVQDGKAWWAHTGDSRLYVLRRGGLAVTTLDHSRVQQLIDAGMITQEMAATHPDRNKIYSCLGGVIPPEVTISDEWLLEAGDSIVLSTDGFWSQVSAQTMASKLRGENILRLMPQFLAEAEKTAGNSSDNLSVVALTWEKQDEEERDSDTTVTSTVPLDGFRTQTNLDQGDASVPPEEVSEEEIERAIAEIQNAIRKVSR
jgi:serine/threonine protein phosphatase PrpC